MSSVEILLTTTAFESSLGAEQGKIMARAMSDHIDHTGEFKFREVRSGWGVCEGVSFQSQMSRSRLTPCLFTPLPLGSPEAVAKFKCLSFLHRAPVLKGLAVFVEKEKSGSTTVLLDLGKMNPREFYSVCLVAGHPPILIKPHVDNVGNILKSHFDIAVGLDFFKTRIQDVFDDEILVKELVRRLLENSRLHCSSHLHYLAPPSPRSTHCASFSPAASASHHNGLFDQGISRSR